MLLHRLTLYISTHKTLDNPALAGARNKKCPKIWDISFNSVTSVHDILS